MSARDELAGVLADFDRKNRINCTGLGEVGCDGRNGWHSWSEHRLHVAEEQVDALLASPQFASLIAAAEARGAERVRAEVAGLTRWQVPPGYVGVIVQREIRNPAPAAVVRDDDLRAALTAGPAPTKGEGGAREGVCDHPGLDHDQPFSYCWPCPACGVCKFIGHGPLCGDCYGASANPDAAT